MVAARHLMLGLMASALLSGAHDPPALAIRPVIYAQDEDAARAMKAAPVIVLVTITNVTLPGDKRVVEKPPELGGPMTPTIPLYLAHIRARVQLTLRGPVRSSVEFFSWVWASGTHGGPRLFSPTPGSSHVVFLRTDGGYLHTVGDYPSYDLELWSAWVPPLLLAWRSGRESAGDPLERLLALRIRVEFDNLSAKEAHPGPIPMSYFVPGLPDLVRLIGPLFVVTQLDQICRNSANRFGRVAACMATAEEFPGRCQAYRLAREADPEGVESSLVTQTVTRCEIDSQALLRDLRSGNWPMRGFYGWKLTPERRREAMRVYASAMDPEFHKAACEVAATIPEARDIPECRVPE